MIYRQVAKDLQELYEFYGLCGVNIDHAANVSFDTLPINSTWPRYKRGFTLLRLYLSNYDIVHTGASGYKTHPLLLRLADTRGAAHIHTHHTTTPKNYEQQRWLANHAECVTAVSQFVADWAKDEFGLSEVTVIQNGVDRHQFHPDISTTNEDYVLFVGRLIERKHPEMIIELAERRTDLKFAIRGNGPLKDTLEHRVPENVEFLGYLSETALIEEYSRASVTICPYEDEGFGMVVIESMSCGTPVIGLDSGNLSSIIKNDKNGILCEALDIEEWIAALECAQTNREHFEPRETTKPYSWDIVASSYEAAYNELV
jgi:glycosyltransferase involved in cell wall biosynthesis